MSYLDLLLVAGIVCYIIDVSGVTLSFKKLLNKVFFGGKVKNPELIEFKPFTCSLCMVFWVGVILIWREFSLVKLAYVCLLSLNAKNISGFLTMVRENINWLIVKLYL